MKIKEFDSKLYFSEEETSVYKQLPQGNYAVAYCDLKGFHLVRKESFEIPRKIYGRSNLPERILKTHKVLGRGI